MTHASTEEVQSKLISSAAKAAFAEIDALGPRWALIDEPGKKYLSPSIEIKVMGSGILASLSNGWGQSFDEIVVAKLWSLKHRGAKADTMIVVNAYISDQRREYLYFKDIDTFMPCSEKKILESPEEIIRIKKEAERIFGEQIKKSLRLQKSMKIKPRPKF